MNATMTRRQLIGAGAAGAALLATGAVPARAARRRTRSADVCVVGAGLSGLAAARALVAADRTVVVLEARDRVGGRTLNASLGGGRVTELGGEFAGPTQDRILALARAVASVKARRILTAASEAIWGADPSELSLLYALQYIAAAGDAGHAGGFLRLITTGGGAQERRFVGGSQAISERIADRLGKRVALGAPVRRIAQDADGVRVVADGITVQARHAIVAAPPALAARLAFAPRLPKGKAALLRAFEGGTMAKVEAVYERPFWRDT